MHAIPIPRFIAVQTASYPANFPQHITEQLDSTMHDGSHDMKAFGLGFLRSLATRSEQAKVHVFLCHTYAAMEVSRTV